MRTEMRHTFKIGDRAIVAPEVFTRAGESVIITLIDSGLACVRFDDGSESAYDLDDGELLLQDSMPFLAVFVLVSLDVPSGTEDGYGEK